jgi:hypothetical protein
MSTTHQIHYVHKIPRVDRHNAIQSVGGRNADGGVWRLPQPQAVADVNSGKYKFFVDTGGASTWVVVARSAAGNLYLKTEADSTTRDNLLSLPEFP